MARKYVINGETLVQVKGRADSAIANLTQLGLAMDRITVSPQIEHAKLVVNAYGGSTPDNQFMAASVNIQMDLIHYDPDVLDVCMALSMKATAVGLCGRAGALMGGGVARFAAGNNYIGLNLSSPVEGKPWRFFAAYLTGGLVTVPLGVEAEVVKVMWQAIPYSVDPFNGGTGSLGVPIWDYTADS